MSQSKHINPNYKGTRPPRPPPPPDASLIDAKKFLNLYFDTMDNKRDKIIHLYATACRLMFDGNCYLGGERINQFWQNEFPIPSVHTIKNQDYKTHAATGGMLILMSSGEVLMDKKVRAFSQVLVCQKEDEQWKIFSDNYRLLG